jgi:hypothetical protein
MPDHQFDSGPTGYVHDLPALVEGAGQRLFAEDVFPGGGRG